MRMAWIVQNVGRTGNRVGGTLGGCIRGRGGRRRGRGHRRRRGRLCKGRPGDNGQRGRPAGLADGDAMVGLGGPPATDPADARGPRGAGAFLRRAPPLFGQADSLRGRLGRSSGVLEGFPRPGGPIRRGRFFLGIGLDRGRERPASSGHIRRGRRIRAKIGPCR